MTTTDTSPPAAAAEPTGPLAPLAARSRAAYAADWLTFSLWCEATDRDPLPAQPGTVLQFLAEHPARPTTHTRRLAAINRIHRERGHPSPGTDPAVQAAAAQLRPPARPRTPDPTILDEALRRIPIGGWPTSMFGRRDALLLTLRYRAHLTLPQLITLTSDDLHLQDRQLYIRTAQSTIVLPPTDHPSTCAACIWRRWRTILTLAARRAAIRTFKDRLKDVTPTPTVQPCLTPPAGTGPRLAVPVFMPIDRWGSLPGIFTPTTTRSATALTISHLTDTPPIHPSVVTAEQAADLLADPAPYSPAPPVDYAPIYQAGLAARHHAVTQLRDARRRRPGHRHPDRPRP